MVQNQTPDILGHLDIIKKTTKATASFVSLNSRYWEAVEQALDVIQKQNVIVGINTAAFPEDTRPNCIPQTGFWLQCGKEISQ